MSNRSDGQLDIFSITYPSYAIYLKMFWLVLSASSLVVTSSMVIFAILKNKKLRTVNNLLVLNLLVSDLLLVLFHFSFTTYHASIYLLDLEWDVIL